MMRLLTVIIASLTTIAHAFGNAHADWPYGHNNHLSNRANNDPVVAVPQARPSGVTTPVEEQVLKPAFCGAKNATEDITAVSGPNGHEDFLNCGILYGGWTPPTVHISELVTGPLVPDGPLAPCAAYIGLFTIVGQQFGLPPILFASFAMERSQCDNGKIGTKGELGIMQLTPEQCASSPNGNCLDATYNVQTFAQAFLKTLNLNGGNVVQTVGEFEKWNVGLVAGAATCESEINLDFLQQFFNGWLMNVDPKTPLLLGKYFNLASCEPHSTP